MCCARIILMLKAENAQGTLITWETLTFKVC